MAEKEYIEREATLNEIDEAISNIQFTSPYQNEIEIMVQGMERVRDIVESAFAEDVEEVKHAYWHDIYLITPWVATGICSACNTKSYINSDFPYFKRCPECGAFMDDLEGFKAIRKKTDITSTESANRGHWIYWDGWMGNHDQRIDDATCSECGYVHPTVRREKGDQYSVPDKLAAKCPCCKAIMDKK